MIKKCRFLAGAVTLSMLFASVSPVVFAEDEAVIGEEIAALEDAVIEETEAVEMSAAEAVSEEELDVSVADADYSGWEAGHANSNKDGAITKGVDFEGKTALRIDSRNAYYVLDEAISTGKVTISFDTYIEANDRSFRVYLENVESDTTNNANVFAEVINNDKGSGNKCSQVFAGPTLGTKTDADELFSFSASGWYHFDLILDYDAMKSDGSVTDSFITIKAYGANGNSLAEKTIGAIGNNVELKTIRFVQTTPTSGKMYFANMSIERGGELVSAETVNFANAAVDDKPSNWTYDLKEGTAKVINDEQKGNVLELAKTRDDTDALFAMLPLKSDYEGNTVIEADLKITVPGRIGLYAVSGNDGKISTSTRPPRLSAWAGSKGLEAFNGYKQYDGTERDKATGANSTAKLGEWQTWRLEINGTTKTYNAYVDGVCLFSNLNADSTLFTGKVGGVGLQIQKSDGVFGTVRVAEVRIWNDSVVDPEKIRTQIENDLARISLPENTKGEALTLASKTAVYDYDVTWTSSRPDVINNSGRVVRDASIVGPVEVTLTATVTYDGITVSREFTVISDDELDGDAAIKAQIISDLMNVGLEEGDTVSSNITLPTVGATYGTAISWITSNASLISAKGKVTRPAVDGTRSVKLTAVGELNGIKETYSYNLKVSGKGAASVSGGSSSGGGGGRLDSFVSYGGSSNSSNNTQPNNTSSTDNVSKAGFTDLGSTAWAADAIDYMFARGYVEGVGNGQFAPNDAVTREQFVKMLVNVFGLTAVEGASVNFSDVNDGEWYADFVNIAASRGIVSGMGDGSFGVGQPISRQDMAVMIARCTDIMTGGEYDVENFADNADIADYAVNAVYAMKESGYLSGDENGNFNPRSTATRAETAMVLYRICSK